METNQCTCYSSLYHACTYPAAAQKGLADLCSHALLRFSHYVATVQLTSKFTKNVSNDSCLEEFCV